MLDHSERVAAARSAIDYICGRSDAEQAVPVPNCPGWTVYNAASHIGRVSIAWEEMMTSVPEDPESRARGYERAGRKPTGTSTAELAAWAHSAIDQLIYDLDRRCYFSMTGGEGNPRLWAWHAASELGMHRLDVEAALGHEHSMTPSQALDAAHYTCQFFLQAMRRILERDPGGLTARLVDAQSDTGDAAGELVGSLNIEPLPESTSPAAAVIEGPSVQVLLALWGRPHDRVEVTDGDPAVWHQWQALPSEAFQFGTWD
ncbi:maleylpyruvate isomerase N-terminal domain-containing protein [Candidatus Poriferisodalis sp.]|uniref:maleylpyruvate isomerase N-terminal domain-containing protein n=1 Tax=Candidatus Poriferisodalis sp. TaxID=3101277 RepID=UPI003B01E0E7